MIAYFSIYIFILTSLVVSYFDKFNRKIYYYIVILILILFAGIRFNVGVDYNNYVNLFKDIIYGYDVHTEISFNYIVNFINLFSGSYQILFLFYAIMTILFMSKFFHFFSNNKMLSLYLYFSFPVFYLASFNGIRQILAVAIFAYALKFIVKENFLKYFLLILLATAIHKSAILLLPLYWFINKTIGIKLYFPIGLFYYFVIKFIEMQIQNINIYLVYFNPSDIENNSINPMIYLLVIIFILVWQKDFAHKKIALNMIFISILIGLTPLVLNVATENITRMTSYFTIAILFVLPNLINSFNNSNIRSLYFISLLLIGGIYFTRNIVLLGERYLLVPYQINLNLF